MFRAFPEEIQKLMDICAPYEDKIKDGKMTDAPPEVIEAFEKTKKWAWEEMDYYM